MFQAENSTAEARPSARRAGRPRRTGAGGRRRPRGSRPFPGLAPGAAKSFQPKSAAPASAANRRTQPPRRSQERPAPARSRRRDPRSRLPPPVRADEVHLPQSLEKSSSGKSNSSSDGGVGGGSRSPAPGGEAEESCALPPPGHSGAGPGVRAIPHPPPGPLSLARSPARPHRLPRTRRLWLREAAAASAAQQRRRRRRRGRRRKVRRAAA